MPSAPAIQGRFRMTTEPSRIEEITNLSMGRPHVIILGAGASVAAFPNGDKNGRLLPVMNNLVQTLGLTEEINSIGLKWEERNFEDLYSDLVESPEHTPLRVSLEAKLYDYFANLHLPEEPTLYDHLVLSLRAKDVIATFDWDPFLADACSRNAWHSPLPHILFLHGNVRIGHCSQDKMSGVLGQACHCGQPFKPTRLLYPIREKNYTNDPFISAQWHNLRVALGNAYILTIFGYGAPKSDIQAVALMKMAWGDPASRNLEEIEIIDVKNSDELGLTWKDFIHSGHYQTHSSFYESWIARHPRRTCETMWNQLMECKFLADNPVPMEADFLALREWFQPLVKAEYR